MHAARALRIGNPAGTLVGHARRSLQTSRAAPMGFGSHTSDNDPQIIEAEKRRNLESPEKIPTVIPGMPGWNSNLASDSEAVVKAEQSDLESFDVMQEHTVETLRVTYGVPNKETGKMENGHFGDLTPGNPNDPGFTSQSG